MSNYFKMDGKDKCYLIGMLVVSGLCFLPWSRDINVAGMSLFGWLMAAVMLLTPIGAFILFFAEKKKALGE